MNRIEEIIQQQIIEAWNNSHTLLNPSAYSERQRLYCVYNNAANKQEGNKMRTMGVRRGVADLAYIQEDGRTHYIELKTETGFQSDEQLEFQSLCLRLGARYSICRSYSEFWQTIGVPAPFNESELKTKLPQRIR